LESVAADGNLDLMGLEMSNEMFWVRFLLGLERVAFVFWLPTKLRSFRESCIDFSHFWLG